MLKYWPLLVIAGVLVIIIGMSHDADSSKYRYDERAAQAKATSVAKGDDGKAGNDADKPYKPPVWAKFVTWPEGVGAWAVILTLLAIAWQSVETRATAKATESSLEAIRRQTDIQVAALQQWVEIELYDVRSNELIEDRADGAAVIATNILFRAVNSTTLPLTIKKIVTRVSGHSTDWQTSTVEETTTLPPSRKDNALNYPFFVPILLQGDVAKKYMEGMFVFTVSGTVFFEGIPPEKGCEEGFSFVVQAGNKGFRILPYLGVHPVEIQKQQYDQNPN